MRGCSIGQRDLVWDKKAAGAWCGLNGTWETVARAWTVLDPGTSLDHGVVLYVKKSPWQPGLRVVETWIDSLRGRCTSRALPSKRLFDVYRATTWALSHVVTNISWSWFQKDSRKVEFSVNSLYCSSIYKILHASSPILRANFTIWFQTLPMMWQTKKLRSDWWHLVTVVKRELFQIYVNTLKAS